jgi:hypothetical protein
MLFFFGFIIWMWMLFAIFGDLFRRDDISGGVKAMWTLIILLTPLFGATVYLITQGRAMAERNVAAQKAAKAQFDEYVQEQAGDQGPAGQIAKAHDLLERGAIDQTEFDRLKAHALA